MVRRLLGQVWMRKETERSEPVVDRYQHDALPRQRRTVGGQHAGRTDDQTPAVNPHHYRTPLGSRLGCSPDIEVKAVFARSARHTQTLLELELRNNRKRGHHRLHARCRVLVCLANARPRLYRSRRPPSQISNRRRSEGNAFEDSDFRFSVCDTGDESTFDTHRAINRSDDSLTLPQKNDDERHRSKQTGETNDCFHDRSFPVTAENTRSGSAPQSMSRRIAEMPFTIWTVAIDMSEEHLRKVTIGELQAVNGAVRVIKYDPGLPALFEKEAARIRGALGDRAFSIEHVGSTAGPGLAAKPRIDILLVLADTSNEAAYVPALEAAGYVL